MPLSPDEPRGSLHVEELICNVTVTLGAGPLSLAQARPVAEPEQAAPAKPPLEQALERLAWRQGLEQSVAAAVAGESGPLGVPGGAPANVDARALADRIYRLMRDELARDLERE